jgi:hypothetical protein
MIEQLKQFVDRQTPVSVLLALVAVVFFVTSATRLLTWLTERLVHFIQPRFLFALNSPNPSDSLSLGLTLIVQVLILLILKLFIR